MLLTVRMLKNRMQQIHCPTAKTKMPPLVDEVDANSKGFVPTLRLIVPILKLIVLLLASLFCSKKCQGVYQQSNDPAMAEVVAQPHGWNCIRDLEVHTSCLISISVCYSGYHRSTLQEASSFKKQSISSYKH